MASEKELRVKLTADSAQFLNAIKGVNSSLGGLINTVGKFQLSTVGIVAGLSSVGAGLAKIITSTAQYGDELNKSSQKIGMSVEALSGLQYAAKLSDVSNEQLVTGLKKLSLNLFDAAKGTGEAKDAFGILRIAVKDSNGSLRSSSDVLLDVADKMKGMEDGTGKTALMMKMFGKSGADLIPLMNQGAKGIKDATDEAAAFGQVISTEAAIAAEEFNDNLSRMTTMAAGVVYQVGNKLIPTINDLTKAWINYSKEVSKTPSVWEEMWGKISPSADLQRELSGLGIMQGGEFFIGEGPGGKLPTLPPPPDKGKPKHSDWSAFLMDEDKAIKLRADHWKKTYDTFDKWTEARRKKQIEGYNAFRDAMFAEREKGKERGKRLHDAAVSGFEEITDREEAGAGLTAAWWKKQDMLHDQVEKSEEELWKRVDEAREKAHIKDLERQKKRESAIVGSLSFISRSALSENKAMFAVVKAADMAQATMDTYAAATKALATVPYPYNFAVAALVTAAGMANVAKIASTSFGGKGSGGGAAGSATSGAGIGAQGSTFAANQPTQSMQVIVHGNIIDHAAFVRELQPYFREVQVDMV